MKTDSSYKTDRELAIWIHPAGYELDWREIRVAAAPGSLQKQEAYLADNKRNWLQALYRFGFSACSDDMPDSMRFLHSLSSAYATALVREPDIEFLRENAHPVPDMEKLEAVLANAPYLVGAEYLTRDWVIDIWERLNTVYQAEIRVYPDKVSEYLSAQNPEIHPAGRIFLHLVESRRDDYPFAFLATYSSGMGKDGKSRHLPLKNALIEYRGDQRKLLELLSTVNKAGEASSFIRELVETGDIFQPIGLSSGEAYQFLKEIPLYEECGILCRIPNWWRKKSNRVAISIKVGENPPSRIGLNAILDFNANLSIGDDAITEEELKALLSEAEGLACIKGKWVEVNHARLKETLDIFERARKLVKKQDMGILDAMRLQWDAQKLMKPDAETGENPVEVEISQGEWLKEVISGLTRPEILPGASCGEDFHATLREYQKRGVAWLSMMKQLRLGACLADDMGLGKTVQVIALLNARRASRERPALLVVPASLIGNWLSETSRFAPSLRVFLLHPTEARPMDKESIKGILESNDLIITTYGMVSRYEWMKDIDWDTLVLDEAQAIKNPGTRQTKTVKQLKSAFRVAMTGTPVENRLSDLWSLFDFLNKGLLGTATEFTLFTKKLKENQASYAQLKHTVGPFVLRRLKTDRNIIADLPEKIEIKAYSSLTKKQAALYTELVESLKLQLKTAGAGMERRGLVLASLMKFKQICNHPDQYMGQNGFAESDSGKYERLRDICETISEKRERILVFTQFKEMTEPLSRFLETVFRRQGLVLHGGTPVAKRKELVDKFQGDEYVPFMVLSIKAGGVGLNLTAANHVIHFDRWWNPAVENQATDRAFRIGQKKNVMVHKFITKGTVEEKIDAMIEEKSKLAKDIIPDIQESWITEMDNSQLIDLFRLT